MNQLHEDALTHIELCRERISEVYGKDVEIEAVEFNKRGKCAGVCSQKHGKFYINLNNILLNENSYDFIYDTVTHEFAHAADKVIFNNWGHGKTWKQIMQTLGVEPKRCHNYDTTNSTVKKVKKGFIYKCNCREHNLTIIRHNKVQKKGVQYRCKKCKQVLEFVREEK